MQKWVDKNFEFNFPVEEYINLLLELERTISKVQELVGELPEPLLKRKTIEHWSIQENVGHLYNADQLFIGRLEDYKNGLKTLRPADLSGKKTDTADYNSENISNIMKSFQDRRTGYVNQLKELDEDMFAKISFHPRLEKDMRLVDMLQFQVEHDEHHLNAIKELLSEYKFLRKIK